MSSVYLLKSEQVVLEVYVETGCRLPKVERMKGEWVGFSGMIKCKTSKLMKLQNSYTKRGNIGRLNSHSRLSMHSLRVKGTKIHRSDFR